MISVRPSSQAEPKTTRPTAAAFTNQKAEHNLQKSFPV
jgi:hypothetical protein